MSMPMEFPRPTITTKIEEVNYGEHKMIPVHNSPLYTIGGILNVCSTCLEILPTLRSLEIHRLCCNVKFNAIYSEDSFRISRISHMKTKQTLARMGMLFIKSKTLFYDLNLYDFFIIYDKEIMGYFSRAKEGANALSCLMVFPCFQGLGIGSLLVDYSQIKTVKLVDQEGESKDIKNRKNTKIQNDKITKYKINDGFIEDLEAKNTKTYKILCDPKGPEKPFSKKAILCYRKYWKYKVIGAKTIRQISNDQNITVDDAIIGLELNGFDFKKWSMQNEVVPNPPRLLSRRVFKIHRENSAK